MVRRVFFSFHYERDIWRANVVRNSWVTRDRQEAGYWDASLWEEAKLKGDAAIKKMIDDGLMNTSVAVVLIGQETSTRKYVQYEVKQSHIRGNGLLGIYIHGIKDRNGYTDNQGKNPFDNFYIEKEWSKIYLSELYPTYNWKWDDGYNNIGKWVEIAARKVGK